jgi:ankyrin repeat protein
MTFLIPHFLHLAAFRGSKNVAQVLLEAGASLSTVDKQVINPSVKRRKSNIKPFK